MNNLNHFYFTSESVSEGHPDKVADQISDAVLDAYLELDPQAKVACECLITTGQLVIAGEICSTAHVDVVAVAREVIRHIGYDDPLVGFDYATAAYINLLHEQSPEINNSVSDGGAGDQGLMFGYACRETKWNMPLPITMSHELMMRLAAMRRSGKHNWLRPDAKCQVTVEYKRDVPVGIETVVLSTQHSKDISQEEIKIILQNELILPLAQQYFYNAHPKILINPSEFYDRRATWRYRSDRQKDNRRYLWRELSSWRRGIQWQRSKQGGPQCCLCCSLCSQPYCICRTR